MKVGDRLIWKLDSVTNNGEFMINFIKDSAYTVKSKKGRLIVYIVGDKSEWFYIDHIKGDDAYYVWDYFYTVKELRMLKLEGLRDVKSR